MKSEQNASFLTPPMVTDKNVTSSTETKDIQSSEPIARSLQNYQGWSGFRTKKRTRVKETTCDQPVFKQVKINTYQKGSSLIEHSLKFKCPGKEVRLYQKTTLPFSQGKTEILRIYTSQGEGRTYKTIYDTKITSELF